MQKRIKSLILIVVMLLVVCIIPLKVSAAEGDVAINETNFPDGTFRNYVKGFDSNGDGMLSQAERDKVTKISVANSNITSLKGVEYFTNITNLVCYGNKLTTLDLSQNEKLLELRCYNNSLTSIDVTKCKSLQQMYCYSNQIKSIDITNNTELLQFNAKDNQLTSIDVSKNTKVINLCIIRNNITSLDVSKNANLWYLYIRENKLTNIDVSKNEQLRKIWVEGNPMAHLDLSNNPGITEVLSGNNSYTITQTRKNTVDLSVIPGFDASRASNWKGGTVSGNILTIDVSATTVTYTYDIDGTLGSRTIDFKLNVANPSKPTTYIGNVSLTGMDAPVAGKAFDTTADCSTAGVTEKTPLITWEKKSGSTYTKVTGKADYNTTYRGMVTVSPDWYYEFKSDTTGTVNGNPATVSYDDASGKFVLSVEFTTAKEKLQSIQQNNSLSVAANVELKNMKLPSTVSIVTDGKITTSAKVDWNISKPVYLEGTNFDINNKSGYSFVLQGTVTCPENVDASGVNLTTKIKVTVAKGEVPTEAPTTEAPTTEVPTEASTEAPTEAPTEASTEAPTEAPTETPTEAPTVEEKTEQITTEVPTETTTKAPAADDDKDSGDFWWLWLVLAVVVIFIIIFVILKKKKDEEDNDEVSENN